MKILETAASTMRTTPPEMQIRVIMAVLLLSWALVFQPSACNPPGAAAAATTATESRAPYVYAHRGGRKWAPENTMAAFNRSLARGVWGIELDIHRCKSGELVVIHDEDVSRTSNGHGLVKDLTLSELRSLDYGSWFAPEFKEEPIPLLSEVLKAVNGKAVINIEIKNAPVCYPGIEDDLLKMLAPYEYPDKIIISSFDHEILRRLHKKSSRYRLAFLADGIIADVGRYASSIGACAWNPGFGDLRADNVANAHQQGLSVNVWTVNNPGDWKSAISMRVDGIITDDPSGALDYLNAHPDSR